MEKSLVLQVPLLVERPVIGSGCCVILAEDLIREEIERLGGIVAVEIDQAAGRVVVRYESNRLNFGQIVQLLASLGYPAGAGALHSSEAGDQDAAGYRRDGQSRTSVRSLRQRR